MAGGVGRGGGLGRDGMDVWATDWAVAALSWSGQLVAVASHALGVSWLYSMACLVG